MLMKEENAVATFFTPTSQKPPEKVVWQERAKDEDGERSLLVGKYTPSSESKTMESSAREMKRNKVAAFDFVSSFEPLVWSF